MRYQQFASNAYCGASFQDGVTAGNGHTEYGMNLTEIVLSPGGSGYFTCIQNMKLFANKFK